METMVESLCLLTVAGPGIEPDLGDYEPPVLRTLPRMCLPIIRSSPHYVKPTCAQNIVFYLTFV